ncbi:WYL domain-containing protein [Rathayibacter sp. ZW T2_19]|uniref:WYL domain-containing protein n=1 Tax=Rathayibacter rubneri TaxID=2950106 RepID=A0A9X2DYD6_9MICO|nr:WYL domain-containing protein [Rathayibacter rubneri]MCM6762969.1 WYL domain-containing protein [Rathayibacter rubneri]
MASPSARMLQLLSLLQLRRDWPGAVLAERLDTTPRTVRRDVDRLRELGYRIRGAKGPDGGYRLEAGSELPPFLFDDDQALALAVALRSAPLTGTGLEEASARALATLRQVLPQRVARRLDALRFTTAPAAGPTVAPEVLVAVSTAVRASEELRFAYSGARRRVEPHHLVARQGRWYLIAFDLEREDWRVFRADRVGSPLPSGARFVRRAVPGGGPAAFLTARFRGSEDGAWPCVGSAVLRAPASAVLPFAEEVEDLGDGSCRVRAGSWSWEALAASFGRFGAELGEAEPRELAAAFEVLGRRFAAVGAGSNSAETPPQA